MEMVMRVLGFEKHWPKLDNPNTFTTFRFTRKDTDWTIGETCQIVVQQRASYASGKREHCGTATIVGKEPRIIGDITDAEAIKDGFPGGRHEMQRWLKAKYHISELRFGYMLNIPMNKLTLKRGK